MGESTANNGWTQERKRLSNGFLAILLESIKGYSCGSQSDFSLRRCENFYSDCMIGMIFSSFHLTI
jgi:hypothetical protein